MKGGYRMGSLGNKRNYGSKIYNTIWISMEKNVKICAKL